MDPERLLARHEDLGEEAPSADLRRPTARNRVPGIGDFQLRLGADGEALRVENPSPGQFEADPVDPWKRRMIGGQNAAREVDGNRGGVVPGSCRGAIPPFSVTIRLPCWARSAPAVPPSSASAPRTVKISGSRALETIPRFGAERASAPDCGREASAGVVSRPVPSLSSASSLPKANHRDAGRYAAPLWYAYVSTNATPGAYFLRLEAPQAVFVFTC